MAGRLIILIHILQLFPNSGKIWGKKLSDKHGPYKFERFVSNNETAVLEGSRAITVSSRSVSTAQVGAEIPQQTTQAEGAESRYYSCQASY